MNDRQTIFVIGVGRSGTTAMAELLNMHDDICIGIERYKFKFVRLGEFEGNEFEPERFFRFSGRPIPTSCPARRESGGRSTIGCARIPGGPHSRPQSAPVREVRRLRRRLPGGEVDLHAAQHPRRGLVLERPGAQSAGQMAGTEQLPKGGGGLEPANALIRNLPTSVSGTWPTRTSSAAILGRTERWSTSWKSTAAERSGVKRGSSTGSTSTSCRPEPRRYSRGSRPVAATANMEVIANGPRRAG